MVGARQGWIEAPYAAVPCPPAAGGACARPPTRDPRLAVHILPGLSQDRPADVMRGEETQIAGLLAPRPGFDGVACLPGTHTKWAHVSAGEVVSFASFMTGEIFALLAGSLGAAPHRRRRGLVRRRLPRGRRGRRWPAPSASPPGSSALRAEALLHGLDPVRARARLSGLLIGAELAGARPYWLGRDVVLIGAAAARRRLSRRAGARRPRRPRRATPTEMTLAGLAAARAHLPERDRA